jgi:hypothetical protein
MMRLKLDDEDLIPAFDVWLIEEIDMAPAKGEFVNTLRWFYEAAVERILRKRLQERWDRGFLAGIDTAWEAVKQRNADANALGAIDIARNGFLEEVRSR